MVSAIDRAFARTQSVVDAARSTALALKQEGGGGGIVDFAGSGAGDLMASFRAQAEQREQYALFSGWVYAAVHMLSMEAASQPANVARLLGATPNPEERTTPSRTKQLRGKMTDGALKHSADQELELLLDHELVDALANPNPIQSGWEFVYSFVANLNLTGWAFIVGGETEGGVQYYSLPTTWVRHNADLTEFWVGDPKDPTGQTGDPITRENVAFAHLPNPADPRSAIAPAGAQTQSAKIDRHIRTSQEAFFKKGIFPSVIITVGKNPTPGSGDGKRPRLTAAQRRQIFGAIMKTHGSVENYGTPAIVDGLIESIVPFSRAQKEMGWEKSEQTIKTRILSSFGVHPFILGEQVNIGGHAQAAAIEKRYCKRVNTFLDLLSNVMTTFAGPKSEPDSRLLVWWDKCDARDESIHNQNLREGRKNGDVTKNEYRVELGLPTVDGGDETRSKLLDTVGGISGAVQIMTAMGAGTISAENAAQLFVLFFQVEIEVAREIVGSATSPQAISDAASALTESIKALGMTPDALETRALAAQ